MKRSVAVTMLASVVGVFGTPAAAGTVIMDFAVLPSAQGWSYIQLGTPAAEARVFSTDGATLTQDTLGLGEAAQGSNG